MRITTFEQLALAELQDIYSAENQVSEALPKMAEAATTPELKAAFEEHLTQTKHQIERLEKIFKSMGKTHGHVTCEAAKGLIEEGKEVMSEIGRGYVLDAGLIAAAQRFEHYEMAAYGTAVAFAQELGDDSAVKLLKETLAEEEQTDDKLTELAEKIVNPAAMKA